MTSDIFSYQLSQYLGKRGITGPWVLEGASERDFSGAVVIPALAEEKSLFLTLDSLAANPPSGRTGFRISTGKRPQHTSSTAGAAGPSDTA